MLIRRYISAALAEVPGNLPGDCTQMLAVQVADRFHLWQNLAKAIEKCVAADRACLADPAPAAEEQCPALPEPEPARQPDPAGKYAERTRRHHELVHRLRAEGRGLREIARHLGWGLHTVQRLDRAATWQELADGRWQGPRPSKLDPFKPYLDQHDDGARGSIRRLFSEIKALGYDGSYPVVRDYLAGHRPAREPLPPAPTTVRDVTNWLCRRPDTSPRTTSPGSRPSWAAAPNSRPPATRSARSPP